MEQSEEESHAYRNAKAGAESIAAMVAALGCDYDRLEELKDERGALVDAQQAANAGDLEERTAAALALADWDAEYGEEFGDLVDAAGDCEDRDDAERRIQEDPLSIEIRSGWHSPGETLEPEDFQILLTTGGPALRIIGELDEHREPHRAWLEHQNWFKPWTEYHGEGCDQDTLLTYCQQFYFGE
jgi:hypothetical protein